MTSRAQWLRARYGFASPAAATPALADPPLTVKLRSCEAARVTGSVGDYYGGDTGPQMRKFLGIPYAAPPTGANRWRPPQPFCWTGTRDGSFYSPSCPRGPGIDPWKNEDRLYLNIYTESTGDVRKRQGRAFPGLQSWGT